MYLRLISSKFVSINCCINVLTILFKNMTVINAIIKITLIFSKTYKRRLNKREKHLFVNYWFVCILLADMLLFTAAALKLCIDIGTAYNFDMCTLFLGKASASFMSLWMLTLIPLLRNIAICLVSFFVSNRFRFLRFPSI